MAPSSVDAPSTGPAPDRVTRFWSDEWETYSHALLRYTCRLLSGDRQTAEDVVQESAIRLLRHPELIADERALCGWLRTVARNIVIDRSRRRSVRAEVRFMPCLDQDVPGASADVESVIAVTEILSTLPLTQRAAVFEVYVRGRSVTAAAAALGVPVGTVKSRCHYALLRLRGSTAAPSR